MPAFFLYILLRIRYDKSMEREHTFAYGDIIMDEKRLSTRIAHCGLVCAFCSMGAACDCHTSNFCPKQHSSEGCYQFTCSTEKGLRGCWECDDAPCDKDMHVHVKIRAFIRCIKEEGLEKFCQYLSINEKNGIVYHREGYSGDYDLPTEEEVLALLRKHSV